MENLPIFESEPVMVKSNKQRVRQNEVSQDSDQMSSQPRTTSYHKNLFTKHILCSTQGLSEFADND